MSNARESLKTIPAVCRVLVEYERLHNRADAKEMWEILLNQILAKLPELVEIDKAKLEEKVRLCTTYFAGSSWEAMGEEVRNNLVRGIMEAKGIIKIKEK